MRRYVIHTKWVASACFATGPISWLAFGVIADASSARTQLRNAAGEKVGEASDRRRL